MEDLMAGKREFQVPLPPPPPPAASPLDAVPSEEATEPVPSRQHATVLTPALSPAQTVIAIGLVSVTAIAFGRSSRDLLPDSVITFLQVRSEPPMYPRPSCPLALLPSCPHHSSLITHHGLCAGVDGSRLGWSCSSGRACCRSRSRLEPHIL